MKVLVLSHSSIYPPIGGAPLAIYNSCVELSKTHEVNVLSWGGAKSYAITLSSNLRVQHIQSKGARQLSSDTFWNPGIANLSKQLLAGFRATLFQTLLDKGPTLEAVAQMVGPKYDVILHEGPDGSPLGAQLANRFNAEYVQRPLWVGPPVSLLNFETWVSYSGLNNPLSNRISAAASKLVDAELLRFELARLTARNLITVTPQDSKILHEAFSKRYIRSLAMPLDIDVAPKSHLEGDEGKVLAKLVPDNKYILYYSTVHRNAPLVLSYLDKVIKGSDNLILVVLGMSPKDLGIRLNNSDRIRIPGYVGPKEFKAITLGASCITLPVFSRHGISTKLIPGLRCGRAVVTTSPASEAYPQLVPGRDLLVHDTPDAFAAAVGRLIADPGFAEEVWNNGKMAYETYYSNRSYASSMNEYLHQVTSRSSPNDESYDSSVEARR